MSQRPSTSSSKPSAEAAASSSAGGGGRQGDSFDPSGPYGGFGGAGGSQGSIYGDADDVHTRGPSRQRREHEALENDPAHDPHGVVKPGEKDSYGDYGEMQGHHGGYWLGGREGGDSREPKAPQAKRK